MAKSKKNPEKYISFNATEDKEVKNLIKTVRAGMDFAAFLDLAEKSPFSLQEWSGFLHLSERTLQRYRKEKKAFDPIYTEKILHITMLYKFGLDVFGSSEKFSYWLTEKNLVLGTEPIALLDNVFGIQLVRDELTRIEQGVLA